MITQHARSMARAFINDHPRPCCPLQRNARYAVIKGILLGVYTYEDSLMRFDPNKSAYVMPKVVFLPDIEVPFKWRDGMPTGKDIAQIEAPPRQPPHGANINGGLKVNDNPLPSKRPPPVRIDF